MFIVFNEFRRQTALFGSQFNKLSVIERDAQFFRHGFADQTASAAIFTADGDDDVFHGIALPFIQLGLPIHILAKFRLSVKWNRYHAVQSGNAHNEVEAFAGIQRYYVAVQRETREQRPHQRHAQGRLGDVVAHRPHHLTQSLQAAVRDDVHIDDRDHRRKDPNEATRSEDL
jgi:hypothetical protein